MFASKDCATTYLACHETDSHPGDQLHLPTDFEGLFQLEILYFLWFQVGGL